MPHVAPLYTSGGLININSSVGNTWKSQGKVREFDDDWRVVSGHPGLVQCVMTMSHVPVS